MKGIGELTQAKVTVRCEKWKRINEMVGRLSRKVSAQADLPRERKAEL